MLIAEAGLVVEIDLRIGVYTGGMFGGTIGSTTSRSFTVMGDPVNLGSRLEGANKAYGTRIMISERTRELAADSITARELDLIRDKGKVEPTRVFELVGMADSNRTLDAPTVDHLESGLDAYRHQDWTTASDSFAACLVEYPDDPPSQIYISRIEQLRADPPKTDSDGVWGFDTK